ncbi:MAG: hypothetical protein JNM94_13685 [Phycisphaerae bacterium]|nr:hypothetical protein [Phycisphaerae bacterium]
MPRATTSFGCACALLTAALVGCKTVETTTTGSTIVPPDRRANVPAAGTASQTSVSIRNHGTIPYDGFTLPLVSPDGRFVATQTGVAPTWPTLVGAPNGGAPRASGIDVYSIENVGGDTAVRKSFTLKRGLVLGRSANNEGFLVEAPQQDGTRRIGFVRWTTMVDASAAADEAAAMVTGEGESGSWISRSAGEPEWIVADDRVNLFGALGPNGTLAWCARSPDANEMNLVVRRGEETFEIAAEEDQSWMLPTFAADGSLFALRVRDGVAEVAHAETTDEDAFRQSLVIDRISVRADAQRVWQAFAPVDTASAVEPASAAGVNPALYFLSADLGRMATWTPGLPGIRPLADSSFSVVVGDDGTMLWADEDGVVAVPPGSQSPRTGSLSDPIKARRLDGPRVYDRPAVPRRISGKPSSFLLLVPDGRTISLVRLTLLTPPRLMGSTNVR